VIAQTGSGTPCGNTQPATEVVKWLNGSPSLGSATTADDTVSFEDPTGVAGDGVPSGGKNPADGVLHYTYSSEGAASLITCTLPPRQHALCKAVVNDFDARNWPSTGAASPSSTTTTTADPVASIIGVLPPFFANGCNGACVDLTEPASAFTVGIDPSNSSWARWTLNDPTLGTQYGFAQYVSGSWQIVAGPGTGPSSDGLGCSSASSVPNQVLADFGWTCPTPAESPASVAPTPTPSPATTATTTPASILITALDQAAQALIGQAPTQQQIDDFVTNYQADETHSGMLSPTCAAANYIRQNYPDASGAGQAGAGC